MSTQTSRKNCSICGTKTKHERSVSSPSHLLHFIITIITAGAWLPIWVLIALFGGSKGAWACTKCGGDLGDKLNAKLDDATARMKEKNIQKYIDKGMTRDEAEKADLKSTIISNLVVWPILIGGGYWAYITFI